MIAAAVAVGGFIFYRITGQRPLKPLAPLSVVHTVAGAPTGTAGENTLRFDDPFGIAVNSAAAIYLTDGQTGRLWEIARNGATKLISEHLDVPSAVAIAPDDTLIVAETGRHIITRVDPRTGQHSTVAGTENQAGFADGDSTEARFNAPIGVAVGADGTIFVADTYNDRIRAIDTNNRVRTLAGGGDGGPGFADAGVGTEARFHTPCGITVLPRSGALIVADTGNRRLRRIEKTGAVTTILGGDSGGASNINGETAKASFDEPISVVASVEGTGDLIYVADAGSGAVQIVRFAEAANPTSTITTLAGGRTDGSLSGFTDGPLAGARFNRPSGIAVAPDGSIIVADTGNKVVRAIVGEDREWGVLLTTDVIKGLRPTAAAIRSSSSNGSDSSGDGSSDKGGSNVPRWPYEPPQRVREIAATFGEVRGRLADNNQGWFHNGLDIPGAYGETVRLVRAERIMRPLAVESVATSRERIRFPLLGYIHLRVGRGGAADEGDKRSVSKSADEAFADERFIIQRDEQGQVVDVRVRRGTSFAAGDAIGTLNDQYHVHLIAGPVGAELNALAALEWPGLEDTVSPTIEPGGVLLVDRDGREFRAVAATATAATTAVAASVKNRDAHKTTEPITVHGDVRIIVRAYDQVNGNAARRRLGVYRLGYQILNADGTVPMPGYDQPQMTISFEHLPDDQQAVRRIYTEESQSGYSGGGTVFAYIVTNTLRDRTATEDFWHTAQLAAGDYTVRVYVEDFFGNRTTHDTRVHVAAATTTVANTSDSSS